MMKFCRKFFFKVSSSSSSNQKRLVLMLVEELKLGYDVIRKMLVQEKFLIVGKERV